MGEIAEEEGVYPRFTALSYMRDVAPILIVLGFGVIGIFITTYALTASVQAGIFVSMIAVICGVAAFIISYCRKREFYEQLEDISDSEIGTCMLSGLIDEPVFLEGRIISNLIAQMVSDYGGELAESNNRMAQYREYIELWIHEVKTPLAASKLIVSREHGKDADALAIELERIEAQVEQALFYARSTSMNNDYRLTEMSLVQVISKACKKNARYLIEKKVALEIDVDDDISVIADEQWLVFILCQMIMNSAKYGSKRIVFNVVEDSDETSHGHTVLQIADDGCGIPAADVPKVFDRGFIGESGRNLGNATGMGLYLCSELASRMGIGIWLSSEQGRGTKVMLSFPHDRRKQAI